MKTLNQFQNVLLLLKALICVLVAITLICLMFCKGTAKDILDFKKELGSLNRELQLHILELADVLVERPSQYARRVEDISLVFKNLHHLLNSLRPHQVKCFRAVDDIKRRREELQKLLMESLGTLAGQ
ncbi:hypothetical protein OIU76_021212 [Salix suchowensis]|nr:hypothetical protein OIU76_021212 [Salix suchowensis]